MRHSGQLHSLSVINIKFVFSYTSKATQCRSLINFLVSGILPCQMTKYL
jgi:hypothetical protein